MNASLLAAFAPTGRLRASINLGNAILAGKDPVGLARGAGGSIFLAGWLVLFFESRVNGCLGPGCQSGLFLGSIYFYLDRTVKLYYNEGYEFKVLHDS